MTELQSDMRSVNDIVQAIGGNTAVAELCGVTRAAVSNWKFDGKIPCEHFLLFSRKLKELGEPKAPDRLFSFNNGADGKSRTRDMKASVA